MGGDASGWAWAAAWARAVGQELLLEPMPLPPKPPPELLDELEVMLVPREPADTEPALRLDTLEVLEVLLGTELMLLPAEAAPTAPATVAALAVAALTRELASEADLFVAATPPPVPPD